MIRIVCLAIGYVFGMIQTSYFYGRLHGIDIRTQGSGNAGTTNALRVLGAKAGAVTFVGDMAKSVLAATLVRVLFGASHADIMPLLVIYTGAGVVLGHNFPFYLGFRGGKGIAASGGMILAFACWPISFACLAGFVIPFVLTHYVSLGSLCFYSVFLILMVVFGQMGAFGLTQPLLLEMYVVLVILTIMAFYRHRANIQRLMAGNENKTYLIKKKK